MGLEMLVLVAGVFVALGIVVYGAVASKRSVLVAIVALVVALLAAGSAWYSWAETKSLPWTIGYSVIGALSLAVAGRNLARR